MNTNRDAPKKNQEPPGLRDEDGKKSWSPGAPRRTRK